MDQNDEIAWPLAKIVAAWALIGVTSWTQAASFVAFLYSSALLLEWVVKKIIKPILVRIGWLD